MRWTLRWTRGLAVVVAVSLVLAGTGVGLGPVETEAVGDDRLQVDEPTPTNNTTRHEDPREAGEPGDLVGLRGWLGGRMAVELESCVVQLGLGETNVCEMSDQYPAWARKYVEVAEDTDDEDDDERAESFEEAGNETEDLADEVDEFEETWRAYEEAREAGDEQEARRLARELIRLGASIDRDAGALVDTYRVLEGEPGVDLGEERTGINQTRENVTRIVSEIEAEQFVETALTAEVTPETISFLEPGNVSGRLETANGSPVADEPIRLRIEDRTVEATTDDEGAFEVDYRPTTLPLSTEEVTIRYVPRNQSVYLGSNTTAPVSVEQVTPTVTPSVERETVRFGDSLAVEGRVFAEDIGAAGVPVVLTLDGQAVGKLRTDDTGRFAATVDVGANVGPGEVSVQARMPLEDRALASAAGTAAVTVRESATQLTLDASPAGPRAVDVAGRLTTADGTPVGNQRVALRIDGAGVETVRTGADGRYRATVAVPSSQVEPSENTTVNVTAAFDGAGTNLESSTATAVVTLPPAEPGAGNGAVDRAVAWLDDVLPGPLLHWLLAAGGLLVVLVLYLLSRRWPFGGPSDVGGGPPPGPVEPADAGGVASDPVDQPPALVVARDRLGADADHAVTLAYAAVRRAMDDVGGAHGAQARTHWEFLAACRQDGLDDDAIAGLTDLTEAYEQAAYAPVSVSSERATVAIQTAESFVRG